jgi:hypothetical protein
VKTKFLGIIVTLAVLLGLVMVPGMVPGMVSATPDADCWLEITPALTKIGCGLPFDVNVTMKNPTAQEISTIMGHINFTADMVEVTGVDYGATVGSPFVLALATPTWDNATGWVDYDAGCSLGTTTNVTSCVYATIHMKCKNVSGIADIKFAPGTLVEPETQILDSLANDHTDWASVVNGTVKQGSPVLTVDVSPALKGKVKINNTIIPSSYPNTTNWNWDQVVKLEAVNPVAGWTFGNWTGDATGSANPTNVTMSTDKSVTANFVELPCKINVTPNSLNLAARSGANVANATVTIANDGGGTCCWGLGLPPSWSVNDTWSYWNTYSTIPPATPYPNPYFNSSYCPVNDTLLTMTVVGETNCTYTAFADWPMADPQRSINGGMPVCLQDAVVVVNKCSLDYISQLANLTIMGFPTNASVTWAYDGCHGWPYYAGKTWKYNITVVDMTGTTVTPAQAMVTGYNSTMGAWVITHATPVWGGTVFMQQYWSDTARNFVYSWDGGTFDAPPVDVRALTSLAIAGLPPPACCNNTPSWLSFNKTHGSLGIGASELLTVTANTTGLAVGTYNGSFCIFCCCCPDMPECLTVCPQYECVNVTFEVQPATTIDAIRALPVDALQMDAEYPGDWFWVYVNFTAPVDEFNSIGLTDLAPAGWAVETNTTWCTPEASWANPGPGNKAEYAWSGESTGYPMGTTFSAKYKVTIPATALNGLNDWPNGDSTKAWAEYWFGPKGPYTSAVTGDWQKMVTVPGKVVGETRDVNAALLTTTLVVLSEEPAEALDEPEDSDSSTAPNALYEVWADDTGQYWMEASKYCYFALDTNDMPPTRNVWHEDYIDFGNTAKLYAGYILDFEGDYGLVPKACTMSYAMKSVNHWLFVPIDVSETPHPEWQLNSWKAMESVHSWQFPCGCNT